MLRMTIQEAQSSFFDRQAVMNSVDRARRSALSKGGAYVQRTARTSLRKRKKPSKPGQAPSSHVGLIKRFLFFAYDAKTRATVVGPAKLNKPNPDVLATLEYGGTVRRRFFVDQVEESKASKSGRIRKKTFVQIRSSQRAEEQTVTYAARPFMQPALEKNKAKLAALWKGAVRAR